MRGNVCIELHNHKTGLRDRIEGHNDVTDALQTMINACVSRDIPSSQYTPVVNQLLGGVILMDKELSGTDIFVPSDAKIIGSGFRGSNTESKIVGTYNYEESGINETQRIYTHVWDYATSQANGTIKSLGLTTDVGGKYPNSAVSFFSYRSFNNSYILYVDQANNDVYYVTGVSSEEPIYKYHYSFTDLMLHCTYNNLKGEKIGKTINTNNIGQYGCMDGYDGNIYLPATIGSTVTFNVYRVSDLSFEKLNDLSITFSDVPTTSIFGYTASINANLGYVYVNAHTYATDTEPFHNYIYRYDINSSTTTIYDISSYGEDYSSGARILAMPNGDIYCAYYGSSSIGFRINENGHISDGDKMQSSGNYTIGTGSFILDNGIIIYGQSQIILSNMLMTNFNLPYQIDKTSAMSMKVIYTLTQE